MKNRFVTFIGEYDWHFSILSEWGSTDLCFPSGQSNEQSTLPPHVCSAVSLVGYGPCTGEPEVELLRRHSRTVLFSALLVHSPVEVGSACGQRLVQADAS